MHLDISHVLAPERFDRLLDAAQRPPRRYPLLSRLFGRSPRPPASVAWIARSSAAREIDRRAA